MADQKSGPVKPPILDLEAGPGKTGQESASGAAANSKKSKAKRPAFQIPAWADPRGWRVDFDARLMTGIAAGALLGAGLSFLIALSGLWPRPATPIATNDADLAIASLERRLDTIEQVSGTESATGAALDSRIGVLEEATSRISANDEAIAALRAEAEALAAREPGSAEVDLSAFEAELKALSGRIDALATGASSEDASAISESLANLNEEISALKQTVIGSDSAMTELKSSVTALQTDNQSLRATLDVLTADMAAAPAEPEAKSTDAALLPLALSGIESALASGRPFAAELNLMTRALPGLDVPEQITAAAETGLPAPGSVTQKLNSVIPDMLAARPIDPEAGWQAALTDRLQSVLALRPTGDVAGDSPEALVARIENAVATREFATAASLLSALPAPMRIAAGSVAADITRLGQAESFVAEARSMALEPQGSPNL